MSIDDFEPQIAPVIEAVDLDATVRFFADVLGFRIETVSPADSPVDIAMGGFGGRVVIRRLDRDVATPLIVTCQAPALIALVIGAVIGQEIAPLFENGLDVNALSAIIGTGLMALST